jgi:capsular polysaccharide biosynthesis protein
MIVALVGSALGLFAAIALILLFDMLQGSYKTVEDVERGLGVPVLGGVSHLETEEERVATTRSRRRASLLAAAALLLVTAVVSIFYIDPTRLPPAVRSILTIILGA